MNKNYIYVKKLWSSQHWKGIFSALYKQNKMTNNTIMTTFRFPSFFFHVLIYHIYLNVVTQKRIWKWIT